jgi:hypothetical protein
MVKQKIEQYGAQPFHLGDALIGAGAVLLGLLIFLWINYDPNTSKDTLASKIELLEGRVERLQQSNLDRISDIGDVDLKVLRLNNNLRDLESDVKLYDSKLKADANRDQFFDMVERLIERADRDGVGQ